MNQILENKFKNFKIESKSSINKMRIVFWISIFAIILFLIFYLFLQYNSWQKEKISQNLASNFNIRNLYINSENYSSKKLSTLQDENPFVIGLLQIDEIGIVYPILSSSSEDFLKISPCRFYGPMPNEVGNLCIAGHNYANQKHFGRLSLLEKGDSFLIYDLSGNSTTYIIYEKTEVNANDTSCINQNTEGRKEVTLITCNTLKGTRIVIKAKENR